MLPSTGLFKATNCPFYDSGLCERPYCHFRHVKKDPSCSVDADEEVLEQLVSDVVHKVLHSKTPSSSSSDQVPHEDFVSKVVEDLLPITGDINSNIFKPAILPPAVPSYKPTPIAELNKKRHIPVPYIPRNCSIVRPKRQQSSEHLFALPLTKRGKPSEECPISITPSSEYNPDVDTNKYVGYSPSLPINQASGTNNHSYIPSAIANLISPLADYVPTGNNDRNLSYEPTGKKNQEPEYRPKFDSAISSSCKNYTPTNKIVLEELNLDEFTTELELLDEIIFEHSELVTKKHLEKLSNESSIEYLEGSDKSTDRKEEYIKDSVSKPLSAVNQNCFEDVNVPNKSVDKNYTPTKKDKETNKVEERLYKGCHRRTKSSRHSTSSSHKSSRGSKSSTSKDNKHEDKHKHKKSKSGLKTEISKEHKSSSPSKSSKKSRPSSTSKNHKSGSCSKEKHSSYKSKKQSKHAKPKVSSDENAGSSSLQQYGDDDHDDIYANSCSNEPMTDPDDDEIAQECFKIFQEYAPASSSNKELLLQKASEKEEPEPENPSKKQRVAHEKAQALSKIVAPPRRKPYVNPAVTMMKRFEELKKAYEIKVSEKVPRTTLLMRRVELGGLLANNQSTMLRQPTKDLNRGLLMANSSLVKELSSSTMSTTSSATKLRIAHVPNVSSLLEEKARMQNAHELHPTRTMLKNQIGNSPIQQKATQSAPKGGQRSAHVPTAVSGLESLRME